MALTIDQENDKDITNNYWYKLGMEDGATLSFPNLLLFLLLLVLLAEGIRIRIRILDMIQVCGFSASPVSSFQVPAYILKPRSSTAFSFLWHLHCFPIVSPQSLQHTLYPLYMHPGSRYIFVCFIRTNGTEWNGIGVQWNGKREDGRGKIGSNTKWFLGRNFIV